MWGLLADWHSSLGTVLCLLFVTGWLMLYCEPGAWGFCTPSSLDSLS